MVDFVDNAAAALTCPADYLAVPMLGIAGAAIGASRALEIKPRWSERPCLYAAVIGPPGSVKTPAQKLVAAPVYAEQARLVSHFRRLKTAWEECEDGSTPKPRLSTIYVSDITTEALAGVLQDNPRGIAIIRDELTAWVAGMDQYRARGRGSDRQFFLSAWAGEPVSVHRKNQDDGPVFVAHPFVAVVGGLPPDLLGQLRGERALADGFFDRILPSYPGPPLASGETWACVPEESAVAWADTLRSLWNLEAEDDGDGGRRPRFVRLDSGGRGAWERFTHALAAEMNGETFPDFLRGPWSKHRGYCARPALIVHFLRLAAGEVRSEDVDGESIDRGASLVRYFQAHTRKVYAALEADARVAKVRHVLRWIGREGRETFSRRDAHYALIGTFRTAEELDQPLELLTQHGYVRPLAPSDRPGPSRKPSQVYEVNPEVLATATQSTESTE